MKLNFWGHTNSAARAAAAENRHAKKIKRARIKQATKAHLALLGAMKKVFQTAISDYRREPHDERSFTQFFLDMLRAQPDESSQNMATLYEREHQINLYETRKTETRKTNKYYTFYCKNVRPPEEVFTSGITTSNLPVSYLISTYERECANENVAPYTYTIMISQDDLAKMPLLSELKIVEDRLSRNGILRFPNGLPAKHIYSCEYVADNETKDRIVKTNKNNSYMQLQSRRSDNPRCSNLSDETTTTIFNTFKDALLGQNKFWEKRFSKTHLSTDSTPKGIMKMREYLLTHSSNQSDEETFRGLKDTLHSHYTSKSFLSLFGFNAHINKLTRDKSIERLYYALDHSDNIEEFVSSAGLMNLR